LTPLWGRAFLSEFVVPARLLLIEDEPAVLAILQAAVAFGGFDSAFVTRADEAIRTLREQSFDAVLLDLGLPDAEGNDLLPMVREITDVPIIVVSGRGTEQDKIMALDLGADDFVSKPFLPGELLARIRAALRRYGQSIQEDGGADGGRQPLQVGTLILDPMDHFVRVGDVGVELNRTEFKIFRRLAAQAGSAVSRAELMEALYGETDDLRSDSRIINVYMSRIRAKLRDLPGSADLITSARGVGWTLQAPS
jgi:DNA-binding response OmpR family regulator